MEPDELIDFANDHKLECAITVATASIVTYFAMRASEKLAMATANPNDPEEIAIATYIWQLGLNASKRP
jgi:hypothetical protein